METYQAFLRRILRFEQAELAMPEADFMPNASLQAKLTSHNTFRSFYGDTVVFDLGDEDKQWLADIIERLYEVAPVCFCERLKSETLHMTLHDLSSGNDLAMIRAELADNQTRLLEQLKKQPLRPQTIQMRSHFVFNMVNTSLVMGLLPASEEDYAGLMSLYRLIDRVKELPYPFTPHITLAYYAIDGFSETDLKNLKNEVARLNEREHLLTLDTRNLYYQRFASMNDYQPIFSLLREDKL